jgi:aspartyl-tRNA(Asn)/glutamyl-tRNA(Gln) amidotransferase subunit B
MNNSRTNGRTYDRTNSDSLLAYNRAPGGQTPATTNKTKTTTETTMAATGDWETVVGLEVHVQLKTAQKLFSVAPVRFGQPPNVDVDAVDVGLPGALPVLNDEAVTLALRLGVALGCTVRAQSRFARKHYFYPDSPKGYQITQADEPILSDGSVVIDGDDGPREIPLVRAHLEEDAGKSIHDDDGTRLDWNRAGTPLLEVVTKPALRGAEEAMTFFRALRSIAMAVEACDGNLQEGSMRADANVSVRRRGEPLGTRVELKNINSPRFLHDAVEHEARRQIALLLAGGAVTQETRLWDPDRGESRVMRTKEDAPDYRYVGDPDLPLLVIDEARLDDVKATLPELPDARRARYESLGVAAGAAATITAEPATTAFFEAALAAAGSAAFSASSASSSSGSRARSVANWVVNDLLGLPDALSRVSPRALGRLVALVDDGAVAGRAAKDLLRVLHETGSDDVDALVDARGLRLQQGGDVEEKARALVVDVLDKNPAQVAQVKAGKDKIKGFLVGQSLKALGQGAGPKLVQRLVDEELAKR